MAGVVTLCVVAPRGSATRANLESNGAIAASFSPPTIAKAVQIKGTADAVREPEPRELERAERHLRAFAAEGEQVGVRAELPRRMFAEEDFVSVTVQVEEVFDQSPGPTAGQRL
jgi:hypothetical protein